MNERTNTVLADLVRSAVKSAQRNGFVMVSSSRGPGFGPYRLTVRDGRAIACGCKGANFHGKCRHMDDFNSLADLP